jgi:carbamoyl-phosphate synthase large subunit
VRVRRVVVTGVGGPAGRSIRRQLRLRGIDTVGVDLVPRDDDTVRVPAAHDPAFPRVLLDIAKLTRADLVIPTVSEELPPLARLRDPRIVVAPEDAVTVADDKWLTVQRLTAVGVSVPRSCLGGDHVHGHVVSKPRIGRGGRGFVIHHDTPPAPDDGRIVQELLTGPEYVVNLYLTDDPACDVIGVLAKDGGTHGIRVTRAPDVAALAWSAAAAIGLRGPVDVDVRRHADGRPAVLDVNARFGAHSALTPGVLDALLARRC